jgi:PBSX family phage terminase large subunit
VAIPNPKLFGKKAKDFFFNRKLNHYSILHGATQSSKTAILNARFFRDIIELQPEKAIIGGVTRDTVARNVLYQLIEYFEYYNIPYKYKFVQGELHVFKTVIFIIGMINKESQKKIRGLSGVNIAYIDEINECAKNSIDLLKSRLSNPNYFILYGSFNPISPQHWAHKEFVQTDQGNVDNWHFELDDNIALSKQYKDMLKAQYKPGTTLYKRYILGQPAAEQGLIYDGFTDESLITRETFHRDYKPEVWAIGSDSGTSSVNCALLACKAYHTISNKYYYIVVDEVSHDYSRERATQLDSEFAQTMINLARKGQNTRIAAPHENSNLLEELRRQSAPIHGLGTLRKYVPDNLEDIRYLQGLFNGCGSNGVERLLVIEGCTELTMSLQNYVWDLERGERSGKDVPLKDGNDHYPDALRGAIRFLR